MPNRARGGADDVQQLATRLDGALLDKSLFACYKCRPYDNVVMDKPPRVSGRATTGARTSHTYETEVPASKDHAARHIALGGAHEQ